MKVDLKNIYFYKSEIKQLIEHVLCLLWTRLKYARLIEFSEGNLICGYSQNASRSQTFRRANLETGLTASNCARVTRRIRTKVVEQEITQ